MNKKERKISRANLCNINKNRLRRSKQGEQAVQTALATLAPRKQQRDRRYQTSAPTKAYAHALTAIPRTK